MENLRFFPLFTERGLPPKALNRQQKHNDRSSKYTKTIDYHHMSQFVFDLVTILGGIFLALFGFVALSRHKKIAWMCFIVALALFSIAIFNSWFRNVAPSQQTIASDALSHSTASDTIRAVTPSNSTVTKSHMPKTKPTTAQKPSVIVDSHPEYMINDEQLIRESYQLAQDLFVLAKQRQSSTPQPDYKHWDEYTRASSRHGEETQAIYAFKHHAQAAFLRDEFSKRKMNIQPFDLFVDNPTNPLGIMELSKAFKALALKLDQQNKHAHN
jgi:hypothetical protein